MIYLVLQSTYKALEIGLFNNNRCVHKKAIIKTEASKQLIPSLNDLLFEHSLSLQNIDFIAANQGPAPFTTLRVVLATVNGIHLAKPVPLVAVDGLLAYARYGKEKYTTDGECFVLLYAFGNDYYYAITQESEIKRGYGPLTTIKTFLESSTRYAVIGNGQQYAGDALKTEQFNCYNDEEYVSLEAIAHEAYTHALHQHFVANIEPLYLKNTL